MTRVFTCLLALPLLTGTVFAQRGSAAYDPEKTLGAPGQDEDFLKNAMNNTSAEIEWSKIAQQKTSNADVKALAGQTVDDEMPVASRLVGEAKALNVKPPNGLSGKQKKESDKLNGLSGADFDKEYLSALEKVQHDDVGNYIEEAKDSRRSNLQSFAKSTSDTVTTRNDKTKSLRKELDGK
jgi:putative membrane protein